VEIPESSAIIATLSTKTLSVSAGRDLLEFIPQIGMSRETARIAQVSDITSLKGAHLKVRGELTSSCSRLDRNRWFRTAFSKERYRSGRCLHQR
jgi:hypothetical protein